MLASANRHTSHPTFAGHALAHSICRLLLGPVLWSCPSPNQPSLGGFRFASLTLGLPFNLQSKKRVCCFGRKRLQYSQLLVSCPAVEVMMLLWDYSRILLLHIPWSGGMTVHWVVAEIILQTHTLAWIHSMAPLPLQHSLSGNCRKGKNDPQTKESSAREARTKILV